ISVGIVLLYITTTIHCARRAYFISAQTDYAQAVEAIIRSQPSMKLQLINARVHVTSQRPLPDSLITDYIGDLLRKVSGTRRSSDAEAFKSELTELYAGKLKGPHEIGWFIADITLKLGLLGTIIGFILMLGSVAGTSDFDVSTMQKILTDMSSGMGTALYTTLAGLVASMLLAAQYHMMDRGADELIDRTTRLTEVFILPTLIRAR
ncbi:MAG: MotA/TolQ/ExbB proton channel family protein, partial [Gammaproteobacteria bacterium]|nr:MotA/TolQ/ExbB proton channel family protein [Gammaproteobacteria bacterium]